MQYGPKGPLVPEGSYLYDLNVYFDKLMILKKACWAHEACSEFVKALREQTTEEPAGESLSLY